MRFHVADSLTGKIVGRLYPYEWEWTDPLTGNAAGTLSLPLPARDRVPALLELTRARARWIAVEADDGTFVTGGPITARPGRSGETVVVPFADWRLWFYKAFIRPEQGDYVRVSPKVEQATAMTELMNRALDRVGAPAIVVDSAAATGVLREVTFRHLQNSIGQNLDDIASRPDGSEWYTYITRSTSDPTVLTVHVAQAWPERGAAVPLLIEHRVSFEEGRGGNVAGYTWPVGAEAPTRVWALGEGEAPAQVQAVDELPDLAEGLDVAWEEVIGPLSGVTKAATAFEHASDLLDATHGLTGQATFTLADDQLPVSKVQVGDRARLLLDDGWEVVDLAAARIVSRKVTGGTRKPPLQELTLDLSDADGPGAAEPGTGGVEEGGTG